MRSTLSPTVSQRIGLQRILNKFWRYYIISVIAGFQKKLHNGQKATIHAGIPR
jgi:hypothetical protein